MEDFLQIQEEKNAEFKQKQKERLYTAQGRKQFIQDKLGSFINKLMLKSNYQAVFGIVLAYILGFGIWSVFSHLFSINTVVVIVLCLAVVYWSYILALFASIKYGYNKAKTKLSLITDKIRGFFKRKK